MPQQKKKTETSRVDQLVAKAGAQASAAGVEIEPEEYSLDWYRANWPARKREFIEHEIKIRNAFNRNRLGPFILNDAQLELLLASIEASDDPSLEDWTLKCRRLGISTYYQADYLSDAIIESGHHVRIVAQDPDTLRTFVKAVREMWDNLRKAIKPKARYSTKFELELNDEDKDVIGSRVSVSTVIPGQEEKGRGDTITRLHATEIPFWRGDPEIAAVALIDAAKGGKTTGESTAKGVGDFFHRKYQQGKRKEGGVRSHFFAWWWNRNYQVFGYSIVPGAEGEWFLLKQSYIDALAKGKARRLSGEERQKARISDYSKEYKDKEGLLLQSELDCCKEILTHLKAKGYVGPDDEWDSDDVAAFLAWRRVEIEKKGARKFRVEYPENDVDPFEATGGGIFDSAYLKIKAQPRGPVPNHEYKVYLDPANGVEGGDPADIVVIDCHTGEEVAGWNGFKKQDHQAKLCCEFSDLYNGAEIGIESNMGEAAILEVEALGYGHRLYKHIDIQTQRDIDDGKISYLDAWLKAKPGLPMTDRMKRLHINAYEQAWRTGEFKCATQETIDEARVFVQNGEKMEAKAGYHDDRIMSRAGCWYLVCHARVGHADYKGSGQASASSQMKGF